MFASSKKTLFAVAAVALVAVTASDAQAQFRIQFGSRPNVSFHWASSYHQRVDQLASQLERNAQTLRHEVDSHFRGSPLYRRFDALVHQIEHDAEHIHEVAHRGGSLNHLRSDVAKLDRLYHAAEHLFEDILHSRRLDRQTVYHIRAALSRVERDIHGLRNLLH
jgi:hypothetical protein